MSAKDQIKQLVDYFKREPYLKDKTDAMGDGLMLGASLADEANERSKEATETTLAVQEKYKEQILAQDLNPNKDPELVDLRNGNQTAGERVTKFEQETTAQFQQTENDIKERSINIKKLGAIGDGLSHPVSDFFPSLELARFKFPFISDLSDEMDWAVLQLAINDYRDVFVPSAIFIINKTIREATNGGQRTLRGVNQFTSIIKSREDMIGLPLVWFGNSNGHGNYRGNIEKLTFDGGSKSQNNIGIRWHEAGTSISRDIQIRNCGKAVHNVGSTHNIIEGLVYIFNCRQGVINDIAYAGTPSSVDDTTTTAAVLNAVTNASKLKNVWFTGIDEEAFYFKRAGGLTVDDCVFQACTNDITKDVIHGEDSLLEKSVTINNCWFEGGSYRFAVGLKDCKAPSGKGNVFYGSFSSASAPKEGGILLDNTQGADFEENDFQYSFSGAPTQGRKGNGYIYVTERTKLWTCSLNNNQMAKNNNKIYYESLAQPLTTKKTSGFQWATFKIIQNAANWIANASYSSVGALITANNRVYEVVSTGTSGNNAPTHVNGTANNGTISLKYIDELIKISDCSSNFVSNVYRTSVGKFNINYAFNRDQGSALAPLLVTPFSTNDSKVYSVSVISQAIGGDTLRFTDETNSFADPVGFTIMIMSDSQTHF